VAAIAGAAAIGFFAPELRSLDVGSPIPAPAISAQTETQAPAAIIGAASVIDGDTVAVGGTRIRLFGIDAPESDQTCAVGGKTTPCGRQATIALTDAIGASPVACTPKDRDRYGRVVAVCRVSNRDLGAWMVAGGWAIAYRQYSNDYVGEEEAAAAAGRGLWQGKFEPPAEWRRKQQSVAEKPLVTQSCAIKGNVSSGGERIYHVPGGDYYDRTQIDTAKGERWFCSEREARAAGWRRSKV
jgi:endonuclease YncB( thermonuclease family)